LYAYQIITVHEHATATIAKGNNHGKVYWKLHECRGASNAPITPAARAKVLAWLEERQQGIDPHELVTNPSPYRRLALDDFRPPGAAFHSLTRPGSV